jgi:hypothetical protein
MANSGGNENDSFGVRDSDKLTFVHGDYRRTAVDGADAQPSELYCYGPESNPLAHGKGGSYVI